MTFFVPVVSPEAEAYTPATLQPSSGATVGVTVSHTPTSPHPKQGETVNYQMDFVFTGMVSADVTRTTTITLFADPNAPFNTPLPTVADFSWASGGNGAISGTRDSNCSATQCTFTFTGLGNGTLRVSPKATVRSPLPDGTLIMASANASVTPEGKATIANVGATPLTSTCQGPYTFQQEVRDGGAWLVDMKFGDELSNGKVFLTPGDRTIVGWTSGTTAGDWVRFTPPAGYVIPGQTNPATAETFTAYVMSKATYLANDPSAPLYVGGQAPNATWFDSLNWPYDPSTWTGEIRLPVGTKIDVQRQVTYGDCYGGIYSSSPDAARKFGIATQIAINDTPTTGSGYDVFAMPGKAAPARCEANIFVSSNPASTSTHLFAWKPRVSQETLTTSALSGRFDAIAATAENPTWIFYSGQNGSVRVWDTDTKSTRGGTGTTSPPSGASWSTSFNALAFAPDGSLWGAAGGSLFFLDKTQVDAFLAGGNVTWQAGTSLIRRTGTTGTFFIGDMAFDGDGNLWVAGHVNGGDGTGYIGMLLPSELKQSTSPYYFSRSASLGSGYNGNNVIRGLAFLNGKLYVGANFSGSNTMEITNWKSIPWGGNATTASVSGPTTPSDFASCSFPKQSDPPPPPPGPAFQVQKSVVNQDGSIAPAGATGTLRTLNADGSLTIDYLVTVANVGDASGAAPNISDTLTLPPGFTTTAPQVIVKRLGAPTPITATKNLAAGPPQSVSFTIPGGQTLDPQGANNNPNSITYVVTVTAKAANLNAVDWAKAGTCNTEGAGTATSGGFSTSSP